MSPSDRFSAFAHRVATAMGHPLAFGIALLAIVIWALTGPLFGFGEGWQLAVNTGTTIVTFLMVFVIQNSQNRDGVVLQLKVDELIRATRHAHNAVIDLDRLTEKELVALKEHYQELAARAREALARDRGAPPLGALAVPTSDSGER